MMTNGTGSPSGSIATRLLQVRQEIDAACRAAGRGSNEVTLVAVSKRHPLSSIEAAYRAGQRWFGENYAQELQRKAEQLAPLPELLWHFVGRLQRNKIRKLVGRATLLHAVDSREHIDEIDRCAAVSGLQQALLLQLNLSGETTKAGLPDERAAAALVEACHRAKHIQCRGLMTLPPAADNPRDNARYFDRLRMIRDALGGADLLPELSMGMTSDFPVAIACGATLVRVGTAIFGPRS